ncbi:MAG: 3-hydroxyacyl-CoA dehydrogenase NAD-binding domain-containing protein [Pseudomonadota bacterium]
MVTPVTVQRTEGIAVLTIDNPSANRLTQPVRAALISAVSEVDADPKTRAMVIAARGKDFARAADADVDEGACPQLGEVARAIESSSTPVIAALHGQVCGGGLELALAAHYRIADPRASFSFPGVAVGLCPSAGATQRLPRLAGPMAAAELLLGGKQFKAAVAAKIGLVDELAEGPLPVFTLKWILRKLGTDLTPRSTLAASERMAPPKQNLEALRTHRETVSKLPVPAAAKILDCLEAALLLPPEAGLAFEKAAYDDLKASKEARALAHARMAERLAGEPPLEAPAVPHRVDTVGIVGAGLLGTGIAAACLEAGLSATLVEVSVNRLEASVDRVIDVVDRYVTRRNLGPETRDALIGRLEGSTDPAALAGADLVIDATTEDAEIKRRVFSALDAVMKRDAVLATTTSGIDIDGLAAGTGRPENVIGLHFVPPANVIRLCEAVIAIDTSDQTIATAYAFLKKLGKVAIGVGVGEGYVAGRVQGAYMQAAEALALDGADIAQIDGAMKAYGFALGPFEMADLAGLDIDLARRARFETTAPSLAGRLLGLGRIGRRTGQGYYSYAPQSRAGTTDPDVIALLAEMRALRGTPGRTFSNEDIQRRCLAAMANEGARLIEEGIAARPADIDVAMLLGYGFPRYRGGPMMAADLAGVLHVKREVEQLSSEDPVFWAVAPLFEELVKTGRSFADLNT